MIAKERPRTYDATAALVQRSCGGCRFYHGLSQLAGQGKCTHPQRRRLMDTVLVRRRELACRDRHDRALWESCAPTEPVTPALDRVLLHLPPRLCRWPKFPVVNESIEGIQ